MRKLSICFVVLGFMCVGVAEDRAELLKSREAVWTAWFANDTKMLRELVPSDAIVISTGEEKWKNQSDVFAEAKDFQRHGGKLLRLNFPRTDIQWFGDVAIVYSQYDLELVIDARNVKESGRVTEVFVRRNGRWMNVGWHTDHGK